MTAAGPEPDDLIDEQIAYYRERAPEYEYWWTESGPGGVHTWDEEVAALEAAVDAFGPTGSVLELACGTGLWTRILARTADRITAVDASPETMALNRRRLPVDACPVTFVEADLFAWEPTERYDLVFFSFWLTHVPPSRFEWFWALVDRCLAPGGRFYLIDNRQSDWVRGDGQPPGAQVSLRHLRDGRPFRIVKVYYEPDELTDRLSALGWEASIAATGHAFIHGGGRRRS